MCCMFDKSGRDGKLKTIAVSERNYYKLKTLGGAGDSFNDVVSQLICHWMKFTEAANS